MREEATGIGIQHCNLFHIFLRQFKIEYIEVLNNSFFTDGFRDNDNISLYQPSNTTCAMDLPYLPTMAANVSFWNILFFPSANGAHDSI